MHGPINQYLLTGGMEMLMKMGQSIIEKRDESMPQLASVPVFLYGRAAVADDQGEDL
jgi:hypothetical protein